MTGGIIIGCSLAYLAAWLYVARWLYGRWRAHGIDRSPTYYGSDPVRLWNDVDRPFVMTGAAAVAIAWPVSLPVMASAVLIARFLDSTPALSQFEMRKRIGERDQRIAELEREAGIRP